MQLTPEAVAFFIKEEGYRAKWYRCQAGKPTIGIGHVILANEQHYYSATLTKEQAIALLQKDIAERFGPAVLKTLTRPATPNQLAAMVSLSFNIGAAGFAGSSVARLHNAGATKEAITKAFSLWNKITDPQTGKKVVSPGLLARRSREAKLYCS